ncbi:MAG: hypothetical protein RR482_03955, partial [Clostridia bacterium]
DAQHDLQSNLQTLSALNTDILQVHEVSTQVLMQFEHYVQDMANTRQQVDSTTNATAQLVQEMHTAMTEQSRYLKLLQTQQTALQENLERYGATTDHFLAGIEARTQTQNNALTTITTEMRESADLLQGSYNGFVENIEEGLANALGLFDENMQSLTHSVLDLLTRVEQTLLDLPDFSQEQRQLTSTVQGLTRSMQAVATQLDARQREVS